MSILSSYSIRLSSAVLVFSFVSAWQFGFLREAIAQSGAGNPAARPLRIPYEDKRTPQPGRAAVPIQLPRQLTRAERAQLDRTREIAQRLAARSDESFRRALLPLGDHLRQLSLSYSLRQSVETFGVGETREELNRQELARYRSIARQLETFRQPASEGWAADSALAQAHLARAEAEHAYLNGEKGALESALNRQVEWAHRHVELRGIDAAVGMAAPRERIEATQFARRSNLDALPRYPTAAEYREAYRAYRDDLSDLAQNVERWSEQGAPIGRADKLHQARYALAQADAVLGLLNGNESERRTALRTAEIELNQVLEAQTEFFQNGTADLFDLAQTWQDRQLVYDQAADLNGFTTTESQTAHARDFERLQTYARQTLDRRGRIAADLEFITALSSEQEIADLRKNLSDPFDQSRPGN